jgi:hypothetical protein
MEKLAVDRDMQFREKTENEIPAKETEYPENRLSMGAGFRDF